MYRLRPKLLSLIIPVHKQEATIASSLRNVLAEMRFFPFPYEIIVVVDGFVDKSLERAKTVRSPKLRIVGYQTNHGKGYAVRFGMAQSHGDLIAFMDSGGDLNEAGLVMMLEHFRWYNADIIIGSKRHPVSKVRYPLGRTILSIGYQLINRFLFGLTIRDTQVGMKLFRRGVLEDVLPRLIVKKFAFDIEILAVARHLGYKRIYESPVELSLTGFSSITSKTFWSIVLQTLWDTLAVYYRLRILKYYDNTNKQKWRFDPELNFRINVVD